MDAGVYRCTAVNSVLDKTFISPGGYLTVEVPSPDDDTQDQPLRPTLLAVPSKVEAKVGHRAVLECITDVIYTPRFLWSRLDERSIRTDGVVIRGQGSLVFQKVQEQDATVYNCSVVTKHHKESVTQMIELSVLKAPQTRMNVTARNSKVPVFTSVGNGESIVRINCAAEGLPIPEIHWFKDGLPIPLSGRHHRGTLTKEKNFTEEQLAIANIMSKDRGIYQCVAKNRVGVASEGFLLNVDIPSNMPQPPVNIMVRETSHKEILVAWSPPPSVGETEDVVGYIVHYFEVGSMGKEKQYLTNNTFFRLEKLRAYTNYSIYIRTFVIFQDQGDPVIGEPSGPLIWRTHAYYPLRLPQVTLKALSPNTLLVTWKQLKLEEARGPITKQVVQWRRKDNHYYQSKDVVPTATECEIIELMPNKRYEARVLVGTEAGYPPHNERRPWGLIRMPKVDLNPGLQDMRIAVHLSVFNNKPTEILVEWELNANLLPDVFLYEVTYNNTPEESHLKHTEASATSLVLSQLEPETCYTVKVEPQFNNQEEREGVMSMSRTICTLQVPPDVPSPRKYTDKIGTRKVKVKVLNTTSILLTWRPKRKRMTPDFFTIEVTSLGKQMSAKAIPFLSHTPDVLDGDDQGANEQHFDGQGSSGLDIKVQDIRNESERSFHHDGLVDNHQDFHPQELEDMSGEGARNEREKGSVQYMRVTRRRVVLTNLLPLHGYMIVITASTPTLTGTPSRPHHATTLEGVPSGPVNVSWSAVSPKDAVLTWSRPHHINGQLLSYLVTYSHDQLEWKNQTVEHHHTTTEIQDLVSNTNYTLRVAGVTGAGLGAYTTVYVYIRATLVGSPHISTEFIVISGVSLLAAMTCVVVVVLCLRMVRLRQTSAAATFQGGPGSRDDGVVTNCLLDANLVRINEADVPNENVEPLRDHVTPKNVEDSLDDIDDDDDASSRLLQNVSTAEPVFSSLKDLDPKSICESTQVDPNSPKDGAGAAPAIVS
ncbi:immunoglobulin superfamily DCC subclass member 4-like isoform X2 [Homarus americanus]|uniref:immunoglobulin superfamily DCC subclass member 4-like isoform X2 n=1 Tax=Homarus americanus TaxID=6706 RepID=UPI001C45A60A|nr:immunoglobulin superfamily DCC subclass member 4-like isoform X2 [Homarus americanus]